MNNSTKEEWRDIKGYEGLYQVSNLGRVKSFVKDKNGKIRKLHDDTHGYLIVSLGRKNMNKVHRLVAQTFIPNPNDYPEVNHINGRKDDNRVSNLEWVTHKQNAIHFTYTLNNESWKFKKKPIIMMNMLGNDVKKFKSMTQAINWLKKYEKYEKANTTNISKCLENKRNNAYGHKWKLLEER